MYRLKPILLIVAAAVTAGALVRRRLVETRQVDTGGWKAVDPT